MLIPDLVTRTVVPIPPSSTTLSHTDKLCLIGSCFSDSVGSRLHDMGHPVVCNPLGTMFNPASISDTVERIAQNRVPGIEYCERQGLFFSFDSGTRHSHESSDACRWSLERAITNSHHQLLSCQALFLTLGSAWAYTRLATGRIVANNHRQPHAQFRRHLLSIAEVEHHIRQAIAAARAVNPTVHVVLTVSPVRHWREGALESSRSKAHLLSAVHQVCACVHVCVCRGRRACTLPQQIMSHRRSGPEYLCSHPPSPPHQAVDSTADTSYFPSFEILMDELRDYRWYSDDMLRE